MATTKADCVNTGKTALKSGLTRQQLVLLGKGAYARTKSVNCPPWRSSGSETR